MLPSVADLGGGEAAVAGEDRIGVVMELATEADLLEVVGTGEPVRGFPHVLDRGQEQADKHGDNADHDEEFDQGEATPPTFFELAHRILHGSEDIFKKG